MSIQFKFTSTVCCSAKVQYACNNPARTGAKVAFTTSLKTDSFHHSLIKMSGIGNYCAIGEYSEYFSTILIRTITMYWKQPCLLRLNYLKLCILCGSEIFNQAIVKRGHSVL